MEQIGKILVRLATMSDAQLEDIADEDTLRTQRAGHAKTSYDGDFADRLSTLRRLRETARQNLRK